LPLISTRGRVQIGSGFDCTCSMPDQTPTWTTAADLARAWELNRLAERLAALAQSAH
jgi:hypothetical protein